MYCFIRKRKRFLKQYYTFFKRHAKIGGSRPICFLKRLKRASICCNCVWRSSSKRYRNVIMQVKNVLTRQLILLIPSSRLSFKTTRCHDYDLCAISIHKIGIKVVFTFQKHKSWQIISYDLSRFIWNLSIPRNLGASSWLTPIRLSSKKNGPF